MVEGPLCGEILKMFEDDLVVLRDELDIFYFRRHLPDFDSRV